MVKKIILMVVLLPFFLLFLMPKAEGIFWIEQRLKAQGIVIADGVIHENLIGVTIDHPSFYAKGIKVATARKLSVWSLLLYTNMTIEEVRIDAMFRSHLPEGFQKIALVHSVTDPLNAAIRITDPTLPAEGKIDLKAHRLQLRFARLPKGSPLTRYMKHTGEGWTYAQRF